MKQLLLLAFLFIGSLSYSQTYTVTNGCWINGYYYLNVTGATVGASAQVTTDAGFDSTFTTAAANFFVKVPQTIQTAPVTATLTIGTRVTTITTGTNMCADLPLKFGPLKVKKSEKPGYAIVTLTVYEVVNVSHINIKVGVDGKTYTVKGVIFPDNQASEKTYSIEIKL